MKTKTKKTTRTMEEEYFTRINAICEDFIDSKYPDAPDPALDMEWIAEHVKLYCKGAELVSIKTCPTGPNSGKGNWSTADPNNEYRINILTADDEFFYRIKMTCDDYLENDGSDPMLPREDPDKAMKNIAMWVDTYFEGRKLTPMRKIDEELEDMIEFAAIHGF